MQRVSAYDFSNKPDMGCSIHFVKEEESSRSIASQGTTTGYNFFNVLQLEILEE
jgi:hypothetical protein